MKKLLKAVSTISLCLLLLLGYIPAADAAGIPTIGGSSHTAGRSDTVPFAISISNNPGIASFDIYIKCDANIFDIAYDSVGATYDISPGSAATQGTFCSYKKENGRWGATWVKMANLKADGQLVIFNLKIADNAPYGEYQIEVGYLPSNTVNEQEQPVSLTAVAGSVKVVSKMPLFEGTNITTHQGREFDYPIIVKRNSGISGCKVFVECDTSIFTPVLDGEAVKVTNGNISTNASVVANTYGTTGFQIAWMDSSNKTANGTVFTLRLKSAQNASDGIYPVKISYDMANTVSEHGQKVDFECANGGITLSSEKSLTASAISYDKSKKQVSASIVAKIYDNAPIDAVFFVAAYSNKKMLACKTISASKIDGVYKTTILMDGIPETVTDVKLMMLNSTELMVPICASVKETVPPS